MNDEKAVTKLVANLIRKIHGRPRQVLSKLSAEDADDALREIAVSEADKESRKIITARACDRAFGADDLRKNYATHETDPAKVLAKLHQQGYPVISPDRVAKGNHLGGVIPKGHSAAMLKVISDRFERDRCKE